MSKPATQVAERSKFSARTGVSRALLTRKALENDAPGGEPLEASFPSDDVPAQVDAGAADQPAADAPATEPQTAALQQSTTSPAVQPPAASAWDDADEAAFQALSARRKAAGFPRRGKDVSDDVIKAGAIKPNDGTVVAVIVGLVAERGSVSRGDLLTAMASATFPHTRALPNDRGWCQGYVAGAIRSGFLAIADGVVSEAV